MSRLILVLGMHRSGTSLIAKSLECFGVQLGDRAAWNNADNKTGYWEDLDFLNINNAVLAASGLSWDSVHTPTAPICLGPHTEAKQILASRLNAMPLFGLKDPRFCRTLPFWVPIFDELNVEVSVIFAERDESAVAKSLMKRDGMANERALALRKIYLSEAFLTVRKARYESMYVCYEDMISNADFELEAMARFLNLPIHYDISGRFVRNFIRRDFDHSQPKKMIGTFQWPM